LQGGKKEGIIGADKPFVIIGEKSNRLKKIRTGFGCTRF
jgi:hypothetical protein